MLARTTLNGDRLAVAQEGIRANELELVTVIKNLVDNAIRYTPNGGRVDLAVTTQDAVDVAERDRIFDPFYRTLGASRSARVWVPLDDSIVDPVTAAVPVDSRSGLRMRLDQGRSPLRGPYRSPTDLRRSFSSRSARRRPC